ncbi:preprotein translocase subunit SecE [Candidatus Mycobacterium wuenschmannii]|uniref:Protein translocase subunit SecE n=1 Tax=Candidatus Mycobacterium wuenschmannii TaxID=3027808 RepID=A0ABY8VW10_9MYCO|nr:preprotein translocase subunit SecE [Candidatus Mycobacterium wuenschmannii]WIM87496.1 preprotein translocase subunit SecE [Candidatus Mycobacterium wuenschmannii]
MSDERVDADAAADGGGSDDPQGGRTAVVTPQRPTGKRSRQRPDADDATGAVELTDSDSDDSGKKAKKAKKAKKSDEPSSNPFVFVLTYLKQVVAELRKVIWPNRKQMGSYTSVVLAFLVFMVTLIGLVDLGLAKLVLLVFG